MVNDDGIAYAVGDSGGDAQGKPKATITQSESEQAALAQS